MITYFSQKVIPTLYFHLHFSQLKDQLFPIIYGSSLIICQIEHAKFCQDVEFLLLFTIWRRKWIEKWGRKWHFVSCIVYGLKHVSLHWPWVQEKQSNFSKSREGLFIPTYCYLRRYGQIEEVKVWLKLLQLFMAKDKLDYAAYLYLNDD